MIVKNLRTMNSKIFSLLAAGLLIFPLGASAIDFAGPGVQIAQQERDGGRGGKRGGRGHGFKKVLEQLDLTSEQSSQIQAIHDRNKQENEALYEEVKAKKEAMHDLFASDASDSELLQQHQEIQNLKQELKAKRFEGMLEIREILTPEQKAQINELMQERHNQRGERRSQRTSG